jgi:hypothetical protein
MTKAKWTRQDDQFLVQVRCGGRGSEFVGRAAEVARKNGGWDRVVLGDLVEDFGAGDVCLFRADRKADWMAAR